MTTDDPPWKVGALQSANPLRVGRFIGTPNLTVPTLTLNIFNYTVGTGASSNPVTFGTVDVNRGFYTTDMIRFYFRSPGVYLASFYGVWPAPGAGTYRNIAIQLLDPSGSTVAQAQGIVRDQRAASVAYNNTASGVFRVDKADSSIKVLAGQDSGGDLLLVGLVASLHWIGTT